MEIGKMTTEELRDVISHDIRETEISQLGMALTFMTERNYDEAFVLIRDLQDEMIKKELR